MAGSLLSIPLSRLLKGRHAAVAALFQLVWMIAILLLAWQTAPGPSTMFLWLAYLTLGVTGSPLKTLFNQHVPSSRRSMTTIDSQVKGVWNAVAVSSAHSLNRNKYFESAVDT